MFKFYWGICALLCFKQCQAGVLKDATGDVALHYKPTDNGINMEFTKYGHSRLSGEFFARDKDLSQVSCIGEKECRIGGSELLSVHPIKNGFRVSVRGKEAQDTSYTSYTFCVNLNATNDSVTKDVTHWYGGPQRYNQVWPLEKMSIDGSEPYIIKKTDNFGVAERYWLDSHGTYLWFIDESPLWVDQNTEKSPNQVCFIAENKDPYINRSEFVFEFMTVFHDDPKSAHLEAVNQYLGKPRKHPNEKMISEPVWTTWAKYKKPISDATVLEFADTIRTHGYEGGQLEIDDAWEVISHPKRCYGSQEFDESKFSDIVNTVKKLHEDNWRVSLWVHPFVNDDCQNNSAIGQEKGYFVRNTLNATNATWWNSGDWTSHQIDFTNKEAADWWSARLKKLQEEVGIDSFKFDGGETNYANQPGVYEDVYLAPNILTQKYIETCAQFGDLIEFRASFRGQQYGEFIRMLDKDSNWGLENGLATLITTLLQLNLNGYGMVLPDMIGGNGYLGQNPTANLIVRWTQANTFMPSMQFSYLPWDYKDDVWYDIESIVKKYVDLHKQYTPEIIAAMNKSISDGSPVNPPIWWVDPTDQVALGNDDEYLLGDSILVAPVIVDGASSRDVYLPKGQWKDGNNGTIYEGPILLSDYPAPIEVLPYFIKQ